MHVCIVRNIVVETEKEFLERYKDLTRDQALTLHII